MGPSSALVNALHDVCNFPNRKSFTPSAVPMMSERLHFSKRSAVNFDISETCNSVFALLMREIFEHTKRLFSASVSTGS